MLPGAAVAVPAAGAAQTPASSGARCRQSDERRIRTITASVDGLPVTVFKSPCHQMPMLLGAPGFGHSVAEPGAYGIILTDGADVVVHFEDFTLPAGEVGQH